MRFLETQEILSDSSGGEALPFLFALSGAAEQFETYIKAAAAKTRRTAHIRTLSFNTLAQALLEEPRQDEVEVVLLLPWDFAAEADWRSGLPPGEIRMAELRAAAESTAQRLARRVNAKFLYLSAPIPPLFPDASQNAGLRNYLEHLAHSLGAQELSPRIFSLGSYLASGCPVKGASLGEVAEIVIELAQSKSSQAPKVLVSDLDNCLWRGVVAEDGVDGICFRPEGPGYKHFLYQGLLAKLKREGVLIAAISRNDRQTALGPLSSAGMVLREQNFVSVVCTYGAKSAALSELARHLNLGLESFVFVDDNPIELAEVSSQLPQVSCLAFPSRDDDVPRFFDDIAKLFSKRSVTPEDHARTEMCRRLEGFRSTATAGGDITEFLRSLQMTLTVYDLTFDGARERFIQLINKTNQFNLNGRRVTDREIDSHARAGARLYAAALEDKTGSHGEILACVLSPEGIIQHLVLSCRVFQRRIEHAFLAWLASQNGSLCGLAFEPTPRNEPFRNFLSDPAFVVNQAGPVQFDGVRFAEEHRSDLGLFVVREMSHA